MKNFFPTLLLFAGAACVAFGAYIIHPAVGLIAAGVQMIAISILMVRGGDDNE